ncbi:MAG: hypothetical protein K0S33_3487 [Bacteroidetes bacterium]|jgi:hypothetical protein|nr:hypothetical protein [Bacteroidota bacterium]
MARNILLLFILLPLFASSQYRKIRYKYEVTGGIGVANFLGDLGGANREGTHLLKDFEFKATRPSLSAGIRYKTSPFYAFKGMITFGMVSGNDNLTEDKYRNNRNLSFRSPVLELSAQAEFYFLREKSGKLYKISGVKGKKNKKTTAYILGGIGLFYSNPSAINPVDGKRYKLRKMHTEGQGLPGGPKQYSNFNFCLPVGIGMKYVIDKRWSVGAEFAFRKTFTDYIDDVSGVYYDNSAIQQAYGASAAQMADPSLGKIPGATLPNSDGTGAQRGETKYKDSYMFFELTVGYKFTKKRRTRSKF